MENGSKRRDLGLECALEDEEDSDLDCDEKDGQPGPSKQEDCDRHLISPYKRLRVGDLAHTSVESQCGEDEAHSLLRPRDDELDGAQGSLLFMSDYDSSMAESSLPGLDVAKTSQTSLSNGMCRREKIASNNSTNFTMSSPEENESEKLRSLSRLTCPRNNLPDDRKCNQHYAIQRKFYNGDEHEQCKDGISSRNKNMKEICMENKANTLMSEKSFPGPPLLDRSGHVNGTNLRPSTAQDSLLLASYHPDFQTLESREISLLSPSEESKNNEKEGQRISVHKQLVTCSGEVEKTSRAKTCLFQRSQTLSSQASTSSSSANLQPESPELIDTNSDIITPSSVHSSHLTPLSPETASEYIEVCDQQPIVSITSMARPDGDGLEADIYVDMKSPLLPISRPPLSRERPAAFSRSASFMDTTEPCPLLSAPEHILDSDRISESNASAIYDTLDFEVDGADNQGTQELSTEAKSTMCIGVSTDDLNQEQFSSDALSVNLQGHSDDILRYKPHQTTLQRQSRTQRSTSVAIDQYQFDTPHLKSSHGTSAASNVPASSSASTEVIFPHFISPNPVDPLSFSSSEDIAFNLPPPQSYNHGPKSTLLNAHVSDARGLSTASKAGSSSSSLLKSLSVGSNPIGFPNFEHEYVNHGVETHFASCAPELYQHYQRPLAMEHFNQGDFGLRRQDLGGSSEGFSVCLLPRDVRHRTRSIATSSSQDSSQSRNRLQDFEAEREDIDVMENSYPSSLAISCRKARRAVLQSSGHIKLAIYMNVGLLTVHVIKARNLSSSWSSQCDSYVKMSVVPDGSRRTRCKTAVSSNTNCPVFDQKFSIEILEEDKKKRLLISVWHKDTDNG